MANFKSSQMLVLEDLLDMGSGYVLNFSDKTFSTFFDEELSINIDDLKYFENGGSKGKRTRHFLQTESRPVVVRALKALWEHRQALLERSGQPDKVPDAMRKMSTLVQSIGGTWDGPTPAAAPKKTQVFPAVISALLVRFTDLLSVAPHRRGYDFEKFLKDLFDAYHMEARDPFRNTGEQIDGSFQLDGATYLLEAKWQNPKTNASELWTFNGKIDEKAFWSRGLFVSYSGFTDEGIAAFGRGKKVICMDGLDIYEALSRSIPMDAIIIEKSRQAASTGDIFKRVSDLFRT